VSSALSVTRGRRAAAVATGATALALALAGCGGDSAGTVADATPSPSATSAAPSPSASSASPTASGTPTPTPTEDEGQVVEVTVAGGKVSGPDGRVKVKKGDTVTLRVTSDVADEIHLHGYDETVDVQAGGTAELTFEATLDGVFEAELEERALQLVEFQIQ
jgi:FtsP/CotA-like multicopper oxidase with cupredoxin domain